MNQQKQIEIAAKLLEWMDEQGELPPNEKICVLRTAAEIAEQNLAAHSLAMAMKRAFTK